MVNLQEMKFKAFSFGGSAEPEQTVSIASELDDGKMQHGVWQCGPGELSLTMNWAETAYILEGRAELENLESREIVNLRPGMLVSFERGSRWKWKIPWRIKKVFTIVE